MNISQQVVWRRKVGNDPFDITSLVLRPPFPSEHYYGYRAWAWLYQVSHILLLS